jgi:hypothetical protein
MMDTETGELVERRLEHENAEAQAFYAGLPKPVLVPRPSLLEGGDFLGVILVWVQGFKPRTRP